MGILYHFEDAYTKKNPLPPINQLSLLVRASHDLVGGMRLITVGDMEFKISEELSEEEGFAELFSDVWTGRPGCTFILASLCLRYLYNFEFLQIICDLYVLISNPTIQKKRFQSVGSLDCFMQLPVA